MDLSISGSGDKKAFKALHGGTKEIAKWTLETQRQKTHASLLQNEKKSLLLLIDIMCSENRSSEKVKDITSATVHQFILLSKRTQHSEDLRSVSRK